MTLFRTVFLLIGLILLVVSAPASAADFDVLQSPPPEGVPCDSGAVQSFSSVWYGHFSGGRSVYPGPGAGISLDWRDETLCFPSQRSCGRYMRGMRHDFHRPEGYFTCLPIR